MAVSLLSLFYRSKSSTISDLNRSSEGKSHDPTCVVSSLCIRIHILSEKNISLKLCFLLLQIPIQYHFTLNRAIQFNSLTVQARTPDISSKAGFHEFLWIPIGLLSFSGLVLETDIAAAIAIVPQRIPEIASTWNEIEGTISRSPIPISAIRLIASVYIKILWQPVYHYKRG